MKTDAVITDVIVVSKDKSCLQPIIGKLLELNSFFSFKNDAKITYFFQSISKMDN